MRKLTLKKETLAELSTEELTAVVGGTIYTKYGGTVSYQACNPLSRDVCLAQSIRPCPTRD